MVERSSIQWGTTTIPYAIRRSDRRATVSVAVEPAGVVVLTAPRATPVERLDRVVRAKARWIVDRQRRATPAAAPAREYESGETFLYLGRQYRLRVVPGRVEEPDVALRHGWLVVTVPRAVDGRAAVVRGALVAWYRRHAEERLVERVAHWSKKIGVVEPRVLIREPRLRWGSCDRRGVLRLNWRIVQAPSTVVDYVVAHELVHLVHEGHGRAFWARLGRAMPDYEERRDALREIGARLTW